MENHSQSRNECSRKRKSEGSEKMPAAKKRTVNFHSIADLMTSDSVETCQVAKTSQQPVQRIADEINSADSNINRSTESDMTPRRPNSSLGPHSFLPIHTYPILPGGVERPPSLTPPASPELIVGTKGAHPSPESAVGGKSAKPKRDCGPDPKKGRTIYTSEQLYLLESIFNRTQYPDGNMMAQLARDLGVTETKIKVWFQNKRARFRRKINDPSSSGNNAQTHAHSPSTTPPQLPAMPATPGECLPSPSGWMPPKYPMMPFSPQASFHNGLVPAFLPMHGLPIPMDQGFTFGPTKGHFPGMPMGVFHNPLPSPVSPNDRRMSISPNQTAIHQQKLTKMNIVSPTTV